MCVKEAAVLYKVDVDGIIEKVKQEFAAKERARGNEAHADASSQARVKAHSTSTYPKLPGPRHATPLASCSATILPDDKLKVS